MADAVYGMAFGAMETVIRALLPGPDEDPVKRMLMDCQASLADGWHRLSEYKTELLGKDKKECFAALSDAKEHLDEAWQRWKDAKQEAWENRRAQGRERHDAFLARVRANIDKNEDRLDRLRSVLDHKESHLSELEEKRDSARTDHFRSVVEGWIDEEEQAIDDIRQKIAEIERWIDEDRSKL